MCFFVFHTVFPRFQNTVYNAILLEEPRFLGDHP